MRSKPARLIGFLAAAALVLGLGATAGSLAVAGPEGTRVVADNKGPATVTP
jgi:hypothetical protein